MGPDGVSADMLRAAKDLLSPWLASFFNAIQSVGYCPDDMRSGLVVPVYKPGKPLGKPKSYRPIMLLSVVRKVLTSVITKRSTDDITVYVSETQAGFRPGRSTADGVFYTRSLCERALLGNWTYSVTLLDFSGAFDTIIRTTALDRLEEADISTTTIKSLLSNTTARIKLSGSLSPPFPTNIGVVQGDPMSPIMFITYAEGTMRKIRERCTIRSPMPAPTTQYADDTTLHNRNDDEAKALVAECEPIFNEDNLKLNTQKTEYVDVTRNSNEWRSIKLLGSLLGSAEDVDMRISKANRAFGSISWRRHSFQSRLCMFNCLIMPILLYNCGLWTLSKLLNDKLDKWQRRKLRVLLQIVYPQRITNNNLYTETKQSPVSATCRRRRLLWFGHVVREGPESASFQALELSINTNDIKKPRGRPPLRWIDTIRHDLKAADLSVESALQAAGDRLTWLDTVDRCVDSAPV